VQITHLRIGDQSFYLDPAQDVPALKAAVVEAVTLGTRFVEFLAVGPRVVSVLVTPHLGVRFEAWEREDDEVSTWQAAPPDLGFDLLD
jgi:hypothetical protein